MTARSTESRDGPGKLVGERRHATLVFSDLSGYTALNEALDPEEVVEAMEQIKTAARRLAGEHGGLVNQVVGDEVVMLFGMPTTHGDDPRRAVEAAIALNDEVTELSRPLQAKLGRPLRMHTAVHTGLVLFTEGEDGGGRYGITGDVVNVAARIRSAAAAGQILLGPETHALVEPFFETTQSDPIALKGKSDPVVTHRVLARGEYKSQFDVAEARGLLAHVGRESEMELLHDRLDRAKTGEFQLVSVVGDAGVGKSRLLHDLREREEIRDCRLLAGACESYGSVPPYQPFLSALRSLFELSSEETSAQSAERVAKYLCALDQALEERIPFLLAIQSLSSGDHPLPQGLAGASLQETIIEALCALFRALATRDPLVLVLEDWHWADSTSNLTLQRVATALSGHAALMVVSYRPDIRPSWEPLASHVLDLRALGSAETAQLAQEALQVDALSPGLSNFLFARTAGNPLFTEEFCRALLDHDQIRIEEGVAHLRATNTAEALPLSVQAVVRGRVDHLPAQEREVLSLAAVIGSQFAVALLESIVEHPAELSQILGGLEDARMIRRITDVGDYAFSHVVVKEVVYESLLKRRRRELHAEVAQYIEQTYEGDRLPEYFETLARHFGAGEMFEQAVRYSELAGDKATHARSPEQASDHYHRAVEYLDLMPVDDEQRRRRVDMSLKWGKASIWRPSPEQLNVLQQSAEIAHAIGYDAAVNQAFYWMGWHEYTLGNQATAIEHLEKCVDGAQAESDMRLEAQAHANLGYCLAVGRDFEQALGRLQRASELQKQSPRRLWGDAYSRGYQGLIHGDLGDFELAYESLKSAEATAVEQNDLPLLSSILTQLGIVQTYQGDWEKSLATGRRLETVSERVQGVYTMEMSKAIQGYASSYLAQNLGEDPRAIAMMEGAIGRLEDLSLRLTMSWNLASLAEALALRGHAERAGRLAQQALDRVVLADRMGDVMAHRALAIALVRRPRPDRTAAMEQFAYADQAANRSGLLREKAITGYWRAEVSRDLEDDAAARAACEPAAKTFEELGMLWYLERSRALMRAL